MIYKTAPIFAVASGVSTLAAPASAQSKAAQMDKPVELTSSTRILNAERPGQTIRVSDFAREKKTVVLVFLANRCGVTWLYVDKITALQKQYASKTDVTFIGVHSNHEESDRELTDALTKRGVKITVLDDKPRQEIARYFGAKVTPYFVVIDAKGVLRYKGPLDKMGGSVAESRRPQYLRPAVDAVLTGKPVQLKTVRALGCEITPRKP
ncbi:MAG: redoxin family protein [Akkermansiaceae bacterium]|nr:redoxin family protein [Armatimonadota bacterium]